MAGWNDATRIASSLTLTVFDEDSAPKTMRLSDFGKSTITFGREPDNDIQLNSIIVSRHHGRFVLAGDGWRIEDCGSTNGLIHNNAQISIRTLSEGDLIRIDDAEKALREGVLFTFSDEGAAHSTWQTLPLETGRDYTIGRAASNDIVLPHISVARCNARLLSDGAGWRLEDSGDGSRVIVNGSQIAGAVALNEKDVINITNSTLIFTSRAIYYCCRQGGVSVDTASVVVQRRRGMKRFITCDHVSLDIKPGELVAIIGGSGAGKSTVLNCMCGYLKPAEGQVFINGVDLYRNFATMKQLVGYVPQSDIVYDNLTLYDMLKYTAKLRLPQDTTREEREAAIERAIQQVDLVEKRNSLIRTLSGGQRKRASIAVELLSDPNLLFLDEPASGLDPSSERNLMNTLRAMADEGRTVILVTHSTLQLKLCDKIVFMGAGGRLCYFGNFDDALRFFGVEDVVDIYDMITRQSKEWNKRYAENRPPLGRPREAEAPAARPDRNRLRLGVLSARCAKLVVNDRQRTLLLLLQAPALALLISLVADGNQYKAFSTTKSLLFSLTCSAFWIGMLNAIQEVCKERSILRREYMSGLSLTGYVLSKAIVMGVMCLIQSALVVGTFAVTVGLPESGLMLPPFPEILITLFLGAISSAAIGLFFSALFTNGDRAMAIAPLLLMPQILFSGMIFKLEGVTEIISWLAVCRWSMEGIGTTANLNSLMGGVEDAMFTFTVRHMLCTWGILLLFTVCFLILTNLVLLRIGQDKG